MQFQILNGKKTLMYLNTVLVVIKSHAIDFNHGCAIQTRNSMKMAILQCAVFSDQNTFVYFIATNQRVVAAQRQQRGLVAVTIRGSVLFYSSAI